jgi:NADH-quinone oxidoreductase subunit A
MVLNYYNIYNFNFFFNNISAFIISVLLTLLLFFISYISIQRNADIEKLSVYECGFQPFEDNKNTFDIKYYLVAILFIVFDLELMFLLPWVTTFLYLSNFALISVLYFIFILTFGFIYEWCKGALLWN